MSAIKKLQSQATNLQSAAPVVNMELRAPLAEAFRKHGRVASAKVKLDSRRNSLSLIVEVNSISDWNKLDMSQVAADAGFSATFRLTSGGGYCRIFRVESLMRVSEATTKASPMPVAPSPTAAAKPMNLAEALTQSLDAGRFSVVINGVRIGAVSQAGIAKITKIVNDENRPKFAEIEVVDIAASRKVKITVPYAVSEAVTQRVPSFEGDGYTVKSTSGLTILTNLGTNTKFAIV